jgi:hypothetical protein
VNKRTLVRAVAVLTLAASASTVACREDALVVPNLNQPDVERALATARLTESVISKLFQQMFNGQYFIAGDAIWPQALVMAFESSSQLGNFGMGTRSIIPRPLIDNSIGNNVAAGNFRDWDHLTRNARGAANAINRLQEYIAAGIGTGSDARDSKALSFAFFALGYAHGHLSLIYDSATVLTRVTAALATETDDLELPPYAAYPEVNAVAIASLDSAIFYATRPEATTGSGGWPIPAEWWNRSTGTIDRAEWIRILRSFRAKFRAGVARNPTERAAVNWQAVIADATNGITSDLIVTSSVTAGWRQFTVGQQLRTSASWAQMTPFILGMADTSGGYLNWLRTPIGSRTPFLLHTPDQRFPEGATRAAQTTVSGGSAKTGPPSGRPLLYFRNRPPGEDFSNYDWGIWFYDNHRFWAIGATGGNGDWVLMSQAESDMLAAEGYIRTGQVGLAVPLINFFRTRAGLPAIPATTDPNTQVPGGAGCVPQVPVATSDPIVLTCGNIMEAMKWEKRVETSFTGHAQWFVDSRGWGDLYIGTPLEWPIPYEETFARYGTGVFWQNTNIAALGTYGFGRSGAY